MSGEQVRLIRIGNWQARQAPPTQEPEPQPQAQEPALARLDRRIAEARAAGHPWVEQLRAERHDLEARLWLQRIL